MKSFNRTSKKLISISLVLLLIVSMIAGCGNSNSSSSSSSSKTSKTTNAEKPFTISIMASSYFPDPAPSDSPVLKEMEKYTNTNVEINFVPNSSYNDKVNTILASGDLPMVTLVYQITPSIVNAAKAGAFWEVGPYLKDYPNLSKVNPTILWNTSIDGKIYSIYRGRDLGRNGIIIRKDWLDNLGLQEPKTIDDFYNVLKAFTYNDPDKDGKKDTYGMIVTKYSGPFDIIQTWLGAPNGWGDDGSGKLVPSFFTNEYLNGLQFLRKIFKEGLINPDFATVDPGKWDDFYVNGKAGVKVDVLDDASRLQTKFDNAGTKANWDVLQSVEGPKGLRTLATSGYNGVFLISKKSVKTEDDLKKVLAFFDKLGDKKMQDLLGYGIEGRHYNLKEGGIDPITNLPASVEREYHDLNQLLTFIPPENATPRYGTPIYKKQTETIQKNADIAVSNPAAPFISQSATYAQVGTQLDNIINDARIKFISGQIDEKGFQSAIELWRKTGGDKVIKEVNELYKKYKGNMSSLTK
ncbi:extracellular solute-binding protein [Thermoanaerobacterium sp. RBIITD]|uniref:extracellular solute-binding protein n=1 Tax=Thermoanaerobacterium sp. RBIITD TaxID=1550240 RepID=UPI000BB970D8|nr:extracellular solute-binding protein [Thermoanaerobacterium sp. RBIITD]SNX53398.1 putative aldouronate transport system substrate-binding protein [Thermoanaerobacterium sp. RBIITD]